MTDLVRVVDENGSSKLVPWPTSLVPVFQKETFLIPANDSRSSVLIEDTPFVKYYVTVQGNGLVYAFELNLHTTATSTVEAISNKIGVMAIAVSGVGNYSGTRIEIQNNEGFEVQVIIAYMRS